MKASILNFWAILGYVFALAILVFTGIMVTKILPYMTFERAINFLGTKPDAVLDKNYFMVAFYIHITSSVFVMGGGVFQFFSKILRGYPKVHHAIGKIYIGLILLLAAPSGLVLAAFANGGLPSKVGFTMQCLVWWWITFAAWQAAMQKDWSKHSEMMLRSYAVTLAAMSLRTESYALYYVFETKPIETYLTVTWLSWVGNLFVVEIMIYFGFVKYLSVKIIKMKSILLNIVMLLGVTKMTAQISVQNPNYTPPPAMQAPRAPALGDVRQTEQQRIQQQNAAIMQMHNPNPQTQQQRLQEIQAESRQEERPNKPINYEFLENQQHSAQYFKQSFAELQNMLEDKQDLSLKRAVFLSESAFLDNSLSYDWFCNDIATELDILKQFMRKEKLDLNSDIAKKYMLQKFYSDTLMMRDEKGKYQFTHYPYKYDFDDPFGTKDWRKMFVTKLLRDKKGQCHSMPLLYLIFAEELGVKAWLAYSPQHSYIKTQDDKGNWYNFETTNGQYSTDSWILSSGYVKTEAMRNKIYMDTLSKKETVAACIFDLANAYVQRFGVDKFVLNCADKILQHSPKNVFALQLKSDYHTYLFRYVAKQFGNPPIEQIQPTSQLFSLLQKAYELHKLVEQTGYEDMPENMYQAWLQSFEKEKLKRPTIIIRP